MNETNQSILKELKQNVLKKTKNQDEFIDTKNLFVVFLDNNTFRFCSELKKEGKFCITYELNDYFNNCLVSFKIGYTFENIKLPWRRKEVFDSFDAEERIIAIPIKNLLGDHILKDVTTKKNIINLYNIINEYIKENPYFIQNLFKESKQKNIKK